MRKKIRITFDCFKYLMKNPGTTEIPYKQINLPDPQDVDLWYNKDIFTKLTKSVQ